MSSPPPTFSGPDPWELYDGAPNLRIAIPDDRALIGWLQMRVSQLRQVSEGHMISVLIAGDAPRRVRVDRIEADGCHVTYLEPRRDRNGNLKMDPAAKS